MQSRVRENSQRQTSASNAFVAPVSDSEIARLQRKRRNQTWEEMNRNLAGLASPDEMEDEQDKPVHYRLSDTNRVSERRETTEGGSLKSGQSPTSPDSETPGKVTKKQKRFLPISTRWDWKRIRVILFPPSLMRKSRPWMAAGFVFASWMTLKSMA